MNGTVAILAVVTCLGIPILIALISSFEGGPKSNK